MGRPCKLTDEQQQEICRRYLAGESALAISRTYSVADRTIRVALERHGIKQRPKGKAITKSEAQEIVAEYKGNEGLYKLASRHGVCVERVKQLLKENGITIRAKGESNLIFSATQELEIVQLYKKGKSGPSIASRYGCHITTVYDIAERHGVQRRSPWESQKLLTEAQEAEICQLFAEGISDPEIARRYNCSQTVVWRLRNSKGIKTTRGKRDLTGQTFGLLTVTRPSTKRLASSRGQYWECDCSCGGAAVVWQSSLLRGSTKSCGCLARGKDTMEVLLDGGFRAPSKDAEFYVYELANHAGHCKPGIESTGDRADEEYGEQVLSIPGIRRDAWLLEQAVLHETRAQRDCPQELFDRHWRGWTEVRKMPADDLCSIAINLHEQLLELGPWEFAARYVPMTAAQRATCQQRALQRMEVGL